jgi:saccharopine dehydrogenase-like NADP-dependent oxidoreductase
MKVIVLGAGGMGRYAARTAAGFDFVDELVVGDLDEHAASNFADELGPKAVGVRVDVTDPGDLARVFDKATVVLNTVGPFFRLGPPVLRAAIDAGVHYLDINDDWESTEAMLAMEQDARRRGITAVIGMGASPGMSNLLVVTAMNELDEVKQVYAGFDLDAAMPETRGDKPCAATIHGIHQLTGKIRVFDDGKFVDQRPMRRIELDYPGLGLRTGWTMGHPEAITFPRYLASLERSLIVMTMEPTNLWAMRAIRLLIDANLVSIERAGAWVERLEGVGKPVKSSADYMRELATEGARKLPPVFAMVSGTKDGKPASAAAAILSAPAVGMGGATGVPLAVGMAALRPDGELRRGVFAPEGIVDRKVFFDLLAPLCSPKKSSMDDLLLISRSWENVDLRTKLRKLAEPQSAA